jgi:hypothetical protein
MAVYAIVFLFAIVVQGEARSGQSASNTAHAQTAKKPETQAAPAIINAANQEAPAHQQTGANCPPQSYLSRLFSPENLPNIFLGVVGVAGIVIAICTLRVIRRQVEIEKDALIATQRPRLLVKHVSFIPGKLVEVNGVKTFQDDRQWRISCIVANVGGSKAHIMESSLAVARLGIGTLEGLLPAMPPYGTKYSFGSFVIEPGERHEKIVALNVNEETMQLRIAHKTAENRRVEGKPAVITAPIICFGFFRYRDESGVDRLTGFGWTWNAEDMSFTRLDHPNYEYAD